MHLPTETCAYCVIDSSSRVQLTFCWLSGSTLLQTTLAQFGVLCNLRLCWIRSSYMGSSSQHGLQQTRLLGYVAAFGHVARKVLSLPSTISTSENRVCPNLIKLCYSRYHVDTITYYGFQNTREFQIANRSF